MGHSAHLVLSDGSIFTGTAFGAERDAVGEVVFNTGMTGYQEILTDPSYAGQIVSFTYPLIGNYGINLDDDQSSRLQPRGIVVGEACSTPSNWRSNWNLDEFFKLRDFVGIQGIDTRSLTLKIRRGGVTMGMITRGQPEEALERLKEAQDYQSQDFVLEVTTKEPYAWGISGKEPIEPGYDDNLLTLVALDCGLKHNILRRFASLGVRTIVLPATASPEEVLDFEPDGILLSPGPGDPERLQPVVKTVQSLLGKKPLFGICLGNQLLCQAIGGKTYKMKFGHRGSNHPVKDLLDGSVTITSQNHGFAIEPDSLSGTEAEITQINLNDGTVEGIRVKSLQASSIQYHPEAAPGPWDSRKYFVQFVELMQSNRN